MTLLAVPWCAGKFVAARLSGKDINKIDRSSPKYPELKEKAPDVPESLGLVVGAVFLGCAIICHLVISLQQQRVCHHHWITSTASNAKQTHTTNKQSAELSAGLLSVCMALLLGFGDDVLDIRWRWKMALSIVTTLPLMAAYSGTSNLVLPTPLADLLHIPSVLHLGLLFRVCICFIATFCTNTINIHAGVNGLEVSQSAVIGAFAALYNGIELARGNDADGSHVLSLVVLLPFVATSLGLLYHNWFPSAVFVGDSYTYFAGMTLCTAGVLGRFPKTLLLLFIPQLINFALSLPQLLCIIPCPHHRLPHYNVATKKLEAVWPPHFTLLNLWLKIFGPMTEHALSAAMLGFQVFCCAGALALRYSPLSCLFQGE